MVFLVSLSNSPPKTSNFWEDAFAITDESLRMIDEHECVADIPAPIRVQLVLAFSPISSADYYTGM